MHVSILATSVFALAASAVGAQHNSRGHHRRHHEISVREPGHMVEFGKRFDNCRFTFYDVGLGACGKYNVESDFIVALNTPQYGGGYPGPNCFKSITISANGKTTQATIMDQCPGCPYGGLDLSRGLFRFFASEDAGVITGSWTFNDGSGGGSVGPTTKEEPKPTTTWKPEPTTKEEPKPTTTWKPEPTTTWKPEPTTTWTPEPTTTWKPEPTTTWTPEPTTSSTKEEPTTSSTPPPPSTSSTHSSTHSSSSERASSSSAEPSASASSTVSASASASASASTPSANATGSTLDNINQAMLSLASLAGAGAQSKS